MTKHKNTDSQTLETKILSAIDSNDDDTLNRILGENNGKISSLENHKKILNRAVDKKSTITFDILVRCYGFDPEKGDNDTPNPIAHAAKTQGFDFLSAYCKSISQCFGEEKVKNLINKKDNSGKNAFIHALEGRSYLSTIKLLINYGANIHKDFIHYAELAIKNMHVITLEYIMSQNKTVTEIQLSHLSSYAVQNNNLIAQNSFAAYAEKYRFHALKKEIDSIIDVGTSQNKQQTTDFFNMCQSGNEEDLKFFFDFTKSQRKELPINNNNKNNYQPKPNYDKDGNSALYYALTNNCYNGIVSQFLEKGAFITNLKKDKELNALDICVDNKETKTLELILKSKNLDFTYRDKQSGKEYLLLGHEKFNTIVENMLSDENLNAVTVKSFFTNISDFRLRNLSEKNLVKLVKKSFNYTKETAPEKLKASFFKAVEDSSLNFVKILLEKLSSEIKSIIKPEIKPEKEDSIKDQSNEEKTCLIKNHNNSSSYGSHSDKRTTTINNSSKQFTGDNLLKKAIENTKDNKQDSREVLILLLRNNIGNRDNFADALAEINIKDEDYKPSQSICTKMCSLLGVFGFSGRTVN